MIAPEITDHALLRWMERVHGVDVATWRALMRAELEASMEAYDGREDLTVPGFVVCDQTVVTCVSADCRATRARGGKAAIRLPRTA